MSGQNKKYGCSKLRNFNVFVRDRSASPVSADMETSTALADRRFDEPFKIHRQKIGADIVQERSRENIRGHSCSDASSRTC